jgi:hypothetical protein
MLQIYRYARTERLREVVDGYPNFFAATAGGASLVLLERGINPIAKRAGALARPAVLLRSSPAKAGSASTPWRDVFGLDDGHVRYFGDHKAESHEAPGQTPGNKELLAQLVHHQSGTKAERMNASPLILFRGSRVAGVDKGYVEFCGLGILERAERVVQWDEKKGRSFPNYVYDIAILDLGSENEELDWEWVNARRAPGADGLTQSLGLAPVSWRRWIERGGTALATHRRRVIRGSIQAGSEQRPTPGSSDAQALDTLYKTFDGHKHAFEVLASQVVGRILSSGANTYVTGWLTSPSGDGGVDFVSRLDVGSGMARAKLVVLGQAKCILPTTSVSPDQLARVVARLRRGWVGAYVTTGGFTRAAQEEMYTDEYPVVLVHGKRLVEEVRAMAYETYGGDLRRFLEEVIASHAGLVTHRRPEEILLV